MTDTDRKLVKALVVTVAVLELYISGWNYTHDVQFFPALWYGFCTAIFFAPAFVLPIGYVLLFIETLLGDGGAPCSKN